MPNSEATLVGLRINGDPDASLPRFGSAERLKGAAVQNTMPSTSLDPIECRRRASILEKLGSKVSAKSVQVKWLCQAQELRNHAEQLEMSDPTLSSF